MEKPTLSYAKVEIPTNDANDMGIYPFHKGDTSKLKQDISVKRRNITDPDLGNNSQVIYSNTNARKD